jgi:hypothetical protein
MQQLREMLSGIRDLLSIPHNTDPLWVSVPRQILVKLSIELEVLLAVRRPRVHSPAFLELANRYFCQRLEEARDHEEEIDLPKILLVELLAQLRAE